jgi:uncharacterized metal-binding protein
MLSASFAAIALEHESAGWLAAACGAAGGILLSPDLDSDGGYIGNRLMGRLGRLWRGYWRPYARLIAHRSRLSHGLIIGAVGRMLYLSPLLSPVLWLWAKADFRGWPMAAIAFAGLCFADALHFLMDLKIFARILREGR